MLALTLSAIISDVIMYFRFASLTVIHSSIALTLGAIIYTNVLVPHANKLLHNVEKCAISNKAINMHSRWPTGQYFCVLEPHRGCLHKVKKMCPGTP